MEYNNMGEGVSISAPADNPIRDKRWGEGGVDGLLEEELVWYMSIEWENTKSILLVDYRYLEGKRIGWLD